MDARDLYREGKLGEAIAAANARLQAQPSDGEARTLLFELLLFAGNLERADKQLDVLGQQSVDAEWAVQVYKNLLEGERARRRTIEQGAAPDFLLEPPEHLRLRVDALAALHAGRGAEAKSLVERADDLSPTLAATLDGQRCDEFRDCDDILGPVVEFMVLRDYAWLAWEQVRACEVQPPERPRDLVWAPVRLELVDGTQRRGYMPVLYCGSYAAPDEHVRLGRKTDWCERDGGLVAGQGQRMFLAGDQGRSLLETRSIQLEVVAPASTT